MTPTHEQLWQWFTPKTMQRLWSKIKMQPGEIDCWLWTGATQDGYGQIYLTIDGKKSALPVHRLMLVLRYAVDYPAEYPVARHVVCRNRACCNPRHVRFGTESDNVQDSWNDAVVGHLGKKRRKSRYTSIAAFPKKAPRRSSDSRITEDGGLGGFEVFDHDPTPSMSVMGMLRQLRLGAAELVRDVTHVC